MNPAQKKPQGDAGNTSQPQDDLTAKVAAMQQEDEEKKKLLAKIAELEVQIVAFREAASRAQAELQNAKIRMEREAADMRKFASELMLLKLLPTIDNFQRAFKHLPQELSANEWVKGVAAIEQDFIRQCTDLGLKKMEALGQMADGHKHEVLMEGEGEKGKIIEIFEDGYELLGKVLRPAKVKVGNGLVGSVEVTDSSQKN